METKGKRIARVAGPVETPTMPTERPTVPAETPLQIPLDEAAETSAVPPVVPPDPIVYRVSPVAPPPSAPGDELGDFGREAFAALAESRMALATGFEALSEEVAGLARCGIDTAARTAIEMLAVKTVSDAIAVNAGFARASFDNWIGSSAKFSELGVKLAAESSRPFLDRLGKGWIGACRTGH
jgi:hypothetical protein